MNGKEIRHKVSLTIRELQTIFDNSNRALNDTRYLLTPIQKSELIDIMVKCGTIIRKFREE